MSNYRMYSLVLRQLSPMQKGIQAAHSIAEFGRKYNKRLEFIHWINVDKTIIVLDGGTYQDLKDCIETLVELQVPYATFYEEDLGNILTSISFVVEDKVFDREQYPAFEDELPDDFIESSDSDTPAWLTSMGGLRNLKFRNFLRSKKLSA